MPFIACEFNFQFTFACRFFLSSFEVGAADNSTEQSMCSRSFEDKYVQLSIQTELKSVETSGVLNDNFHFNGYVSNM